MNNQQISLIEDGELETLRLKASWADEYYNEIMDAASLLYPDVEIWADTGSGYSVALGILEKIKNDLAKYKKSRFLHLLLR